jgi:hypothetical protein
MAFLLADHLESSQINPNDRMAAIQKSPVFILENFKGSAVLMDGSEV